MGRPTHRLSLSVITTLGIACALIASCDKSRKPDQTRRKSTEQFSLGQSQTPTKIAQKSGKPAVVQNDYSPAVTRALGSIDGMEQGSIDTSAKHPLKKVARTSVSVMKEQFLAKMANLDAGGDDHFHIDDFHRIAGDAHDSSAVFEAAYVYFEFTPLAIGATPRGRKEILIYRNGHLWKDTDLEDELDLKKSRFEAAELRLYSTEGKLVRMTFRPTIAVQPSDDFVDDPW